MKDQREHALLDDRRVEGRLQVGHGLGLFGLCRCWRLQSLGTTQGNSQHSRPITYGYG